MKPITLLTTALFLLSWNIATGQAKAPDHSYSRVTLTLVYIDDPSADPNGALTPSIRNFIEKSKLVGSKFNDHPVDSRFVNIDIPNYTAEKPIIGAGALGSGEVTAYLPGSPLPGQIVAKWFNRKADGSMSMDLIGERGLYNASDNDYLTATASQRQTGALRDQGEKLLKVSYLLLINFSDVQTKTDKDYPGQKNFGGTGRGYLYKLNWNDSISAGFYENLWVSETDAADVKAAKKQKFDETVFPMTFVREATYTLAPSTIFFKDDKRTEEDRRTSLYNSLYEGVFTQMENRVSDFQVRQNLVSSNPIGATIGLKEGVYVDQRYFVYENVQKRNQEITKKRRAVVRAKKVADNEVITEGRSQPTTFYQVAGGKVDHYGMFLEEKNDKGVTLAATCLTGEVGGVNLTLGYNLSRAMSKAAKMKSIPYGIHIFVDGAWEMRTYNQVDLPNYTSGLSGDFTFLRVSAGLCKDFWFARHFHLSPRVGYGIETTDLLAKGVDASYPDGLSVNGDHLLAGATLGMNLMHNVQLIGGLNYYFPLGNNNVKVGANPQVAITTAWDEIFHNRSGASAFGGLRIMF